MNKQLKNTILAIALVQIFMIIGLLVLPPIAQALPGEFRVRLARLPLGETLLDIGVSPLPTALPAPSEQLRNLKSSFQPSTQQRQPLE